MNINFSRQLKEVISFSLEEALRLKSNYIGPGHLFLGLIKEDRNNAIEAIKTLKVELPELKNEIEKSIQTENMEVFNREGKVKIFNFSFGPDKGLSLNKSAEKAIQESVLEAKKVKSLEVKTEHLVLSILNNPDNTETKVLNRHGIEYNNIIAQILLISTN